MGSSTNSLYRLIPGVNDLLQRPGVQALSAQHGHDAVVHATRRVVAGWRESLRAQTMLDSELLEAIAGTERQLEAELATQARPRLRRVLNATGVLLQTNLGRAPLSRAALEHMAEVAGGYCNLEYDLAAGERSRRDVLCDDLIVSVACAAGTESMRESRSAAVVNNCAAATFLALNTLAGSGGEVLVSRGELVEIGGGFRIPEILAKSGAVLREVGTTNKTRLRDYEAALGENTRLILRVHRSNFSITGFTEQPSLEELVALGARASVPVFDDQGTGCMLDLAQEGVPEQATLSRSVASGATLVAASGDKLLGGPQCGLLVGESGIIASLQANPLFRALRVDKLTYAALEATLRAYADGRTDDLPLITMLRATEASLLQRCNDMADALRSTCSEIDVEVVAVRSVIGGGTTPDASLPSFALALRSHAESDDALSRRLRLLEPAIVGRLREGRVHLDLRTIPPADDLLLLRLLQSAWATA